MFDRATSQEYALQLVHRLDDSVELMREGTQFEPVTTSAGLDAPPDAEAVRALFAAGALSIEVVRHAAQVAAWRGSVDVDAYEAESSIPSYQVKVSFASSMPTAEARRAVTAALGVEAGDVTKSENRIRFRVSSGAAAELARALRTARGVVAAQVVSS